LRLSYKLNFGASPILTNNLTPFLMHTHPLLSNKCHLINATGVHDDIIIIAAERKERVTVKILKRVLNVSLAEALSCTCRK